MKRLLFIGYVCLWPGSITSASELAAGQQHVITTCYRLLSPLVRLACYDQQVRDLTPELLEHSPHLVSGDPKVASPASPLTTSAFELDIQPDALSLQQRIPGARLMIRCQQRITQLSVHLEQPLPVTASAPVLLLDGQPYPVHWFLRQQRQVLESGRGLPAIAQLKSWLGAEQVQFKLDATPHLQFDLHGLSTAIAPLRRECHW